MRQFRIEYRYNARLDDYLAIAFVTIKGIDVARWSWAGPLAGIIAAAQWWCDSHRSDCDRRHRSAPTYYKPEEDV